MQGVVFTLQQIKTLKGLIEDAGTMDAIDYIDQTVAQQCGNFVSKIELTINNLRHGGCTWYDVEAEIQFRKRHFTVNDEKCFSYTTEELETALENWNVY